MGLVSWVRHTTGLRVTTRSQMSNLRQALRRAEEEARTDPLTGLLNRRAWNECTDGLMQRQHQFAVILFDVANLKAANEAMGHFAADEVLRRAARVIRRDNDIAIRMGGDEFALILPGHNIKAARVVRDRLESAAGFHMIKPGISNFLVGVALVWSPSYSEHDLVELLTLADLRVEDRKLKIKEERGEVTTRQEAMELVS